MREATHFGDRQLKVEEPRKEGTQRRRWVSEALFFGSDESRSTPITDFAPITGSDKHKSRILGAQSAQFAFCGSHEMGDRAMDVLLLLSEVFFCRFTPDASPFSQYL
ncbi:hypothetical protein L596_019110 [Steinernema carpocapsae]|uniref:Uncharacterized protein n=1 Tax=Steinernema carpocapsae TaxID=34508 RepID=A0A4U5N6P9_STECR|nr:hypothetical protein L596_019110 [Steinernema carpocapsae]